MRQLDGPAESHFRLSGFAWWLQPRRRQERIREPGGSLDHVGVRSCDGSGGVGAVRLRSRWMSIVGVVEWRSGLVLHLYIPLLHSTLRHRIAACRLDTPGRKKPYKENESL